LTTANPAYNTASRGRAPSSVRTAGLSDIRTAGNGGQTSRQGQKTNSLHGISPCRTIAPAISEGWSQPT
jgi:hypothetical protein